MFQGAYSLLSVCEYIDDVIYFPFLEKGFFRSLLFMREIRKRNFDICFLGYPANRAEYNVLALLSGAKIRIGHRYKKLDWVSLNWLSTMAVTENDSLSNTDESLRLAEILTGQKEKNCQIVLDLPFHAHRAAEQWLGSQHLDGCTLVGMHPGSSMPKNHACKRWPLKKFAETGRVLIDNTACHILVFGGPEEKPLKDDLVQCLGNHGHSIDDKNILHVASLINRCNHFICNDNALMHIAGALKVPTTAVFGPTNPAWVRIQGAPRTEITANTDCQPCFRYSPKYLKCLYGDYHCLSSISTDSVTEKVLSSMTQQNITKKRFFVPAENADEMIQDNDNTIRTKGTL